MVRVIALLLVGFMVYFLISATVAFIIFLFTTFVGLFLVGAVVLWVVVEVLAALLGVDEEDDDDET